MFRFGFGVDTVLTPGKDHVARYNGDQGTRFRPYLHLAAGIKPIQLTFGYTLPHHVTVGAKATIPRGDGLELLGAYNIGLPGVIERDHGPDYELKPLFSRWVGLGYRL